MTDLIILAQPNSSQKHFTTTIKCIVPLPDPNAPRDSPSHPNAYEDRAIRSKVAAIYPDTSSFYWATVVNYLGSPKEKGKYVLEFEDDEGNQREVDYCVVIDVSRIGISIYGHSGLCRLNVVAHGGMG